jgi:hypothetical protein
LCLFAYYCARRSQIQVKKEVLSSMCGFGWRLPDDG